MSDFRVSIGGGTDEKIVGCVVYQSTSVTLSSVCYPPTNPIASTYTCGLPPYLSASSQLSLGVGDVSSTFLPFKYPTCLYFLP